MKIKLIFVAMFIAALALLAGCGSPMVAKVNGKVITQEDLDRTIEDQRQFLGEAFPEPGTEEFRALEMRVVDQLVTEQILLFEADKLGLTATDQEIDEQINQLKEQFGGEEQFNALLEERNISDEVLREQISASVLFQKLYPEVTKEAPEVTDEQALKYYNENQELFRKPESRAVRHILVSDEAGANQVKARLDAGEDFAAVAMEVSQDPGSKDKGGDLGEVPTTNSGLVPEFEQAMNQLQAGQTSGPVKTSFGFHIIQVTAVVPAGIQTFDEAKEDLKKGLALENARVAFEEWLEGVKGNYEVEYAEGFGPEAATTEEAPETTQPSSAP